MNIVGIILSDVVMIAINSKKNNKKNGGIPNRSRYMIYDI